MPTHTKKLFWINFFKNFETQAAQVGIIRKKCFSKFWCHQIPEKQERVVFWGNPISPPGWRALMPVCSYRAAWDWSMRAFRQRWWAREYGHRKPVSLLFFPGKLPDFIAPIYPPHLLTLSPPIWNESIIWEDPGAKHTDQKQFFF